MSFENMNYKDAILARHSVRQYLEVPLTENQVSLLNKKIQELNHKFNLSLQLISDDVAFNSPMAHYGSFRGVKNLIAVVGAKADFSVAFAGNKFAKNICLQERAGYAVADLVLLAQSIGLNTCIAAMTFKKTSNFKIADNESLVVAIALGVGKTQGKQHPIKPPTKIAPDYKNAPEWFRKGIDTVLLAPSGLNQFRVQFSFEGDRVCAKTKFLGSKVDLGIFKFFFELGAETENFFWK